jgi:hypothetical protein
MATTSDEVLFIENPRHFERFACDVLRGLPNCVVERTRDTIHIFYEGEMGASLLFTPEAFEVRTASVEWVNNHIPTPTTRLINRYNYLDTTGPMKGGFSYLSEYMVDLLLKAAELRKSEYKECKYCKISYPREYRHSDDICMSCAQTHLGIIY